MSARPPLRAALLGTGAWARVLAAAARDSERIAFTACFGRTRERVEAFAAETAMPPCHELARVLDDRGIDAVVIALPNDQHRPFAERAAAHGKHVFVEKPIAHTLEDGLAMAGLEAAHGVRLAVGHCARMLAGNRAIADAARRGELGRLTHLETKFANARGSKLTPQDWRWYQSSAPGGPLSQIAIHQLDTLRALGGDIESVCARSARLAATGAEVEDQWVLALRFASGALGSLVTSWTSPGHYSVRATGDRASLYYEVDQTLWSQPDRLHERAVLERQERGEGPAARKRLDVPAGNMFRAELEHFADAVQTGSACELSAENGCQALAAVDAALASGRRDGVAVRVADVLANARARLHKTASSPEAAPSAAL